MRQQLVGALSGRGLIGNLPQASANAGAGSLVRAVLAVGRGLHSSTFQLNTIAFCGIGGALRACIMDV